MIPNILAAYGLKKSAGTCFFSKVTDAAGDHWITVHPNGPGTKGQPVLLSKGGEIKGGMGGKFNGLHISSARGSQGDPLTSGNLYLQYEKFKQSEAEKDRRSIEAAKKRANSPEGKAEYAAWQEEARKANPVTRDIENGRYSGANGLKAARQNLEVYKHNYQALTGSIDPRSRKGHARLSVFIETMEKYLKQREQLHRARTIKRIKQQYEQLNLF